MIELVDPYSAYTEECKRYVQILNYLRPASDDG